MTLLQIGYLIDALVSLPIALATLVGSQRAARLLLNDRLPEKNSIRVTLGSLWLAVAVCSLAGVLFPLTMAPVLIVQLIYKSLWLILFAVPRWLSGRAAEVPGRTAALFAAFVLVYPWLIPWNTLR